MHTPSRKNANRISCILAVELNAIPCTSKYETGAKRTKLAEFEAFATTKCKMHAAISMYLSFAFLLRSRNAKNRVF
jgi:hypothetical protein